MKLYEIADYIETAINGGYVFNEETGEVLFDSSNLDDLEVEFNEKLEACAIYVKGLLAEAKAIKEEEANLQKRRQAAERKAERLKLYMDSCMHSVGETKLSTPKVALTYRKSSIVDIFDSASLPENYCKVETTMKPDKQAIKNAIKAGRHVPGAAIIEKENLVIK